MSVNPAWQLRHGNLTEPCAGKTELRIVRNGVLTMPVGSLTVFLIAFAVVGAVWGQARFRARRRWRSAIDSFARLQMNYESSSELPRSSQITLAEPAFRPHQRQTITG
jgi:hypothetical protein